MSLRAPHSWIATQTWVIIFIVKNKQKELNTFQEGFFKKQNPKQNRQINKNNARRMNIPDTLPAIVLRNTNISLCLLWEEEKKNLLCYDYICSNKLNSYGKYF